MNETSGGEGRLPPLAGGLYALAWAKKSYAFRCVKAKGGILTFMDYVFPMNFVKTGAAFSSPQNDLFGILPFIPFKISGIH